MLELIQFLFSSFWTWLGAGNALGRALGGIVRINITRSRD
jgi:hypothetical protein